MEQRHGLKFSIALKLICVVGLVELVIMLVFARFEVIEQFPILEALLDTFTLSIIIIVAFYYLLNKPLKSILSSISAVQNGNLDVEAKISSTDEIGVLAKAFNQMIQDLKEQRAQLVDKDYVESIIANMIDTLIVVNSEGVIKTINQATKELLGYEEIELIGKPVEMLFAKEEEAIIFKGRRQEVLIKEGSIRNYDMNYRTKKGDIIPVSLSGAVMKNKEGEIVGIVGIARDMREIKQLEAQLIRSEKLAAIGKLAAGVAHEINNPLNVISGNAEILSKESQDKEIKRTTKIIMEQVKRSATIVERLLRFSKKIKPKIENVNINKILEDTLCLSQYQTKYQNVKIIKDLSSSLPEVMADFGQLQEVFLNIILNAIQAMPNGGELTIRTYAKNITDFGKRKTDIFKKGMKIVLIEFEDTGEGIPEEELSMIFDPFFSTKEQGTGLGLSICHGIIEAHQGTIEAQSKVGKGTIFILRLPAQREKGVHNG